MKYPKQRFLQRTDPRLKAARWKRRRNRKLRRWLVLLGCILLLVFFALRVGSHPHARAAAGAPSRPALPAPARLRTTAWLRAGTAWSAAAQAHLHNALAALAADDAFPSTTGILVADARDGRILYSRGAHAALVPGSTLKLITASATLAVLGPQHRFVTSMVTDGAVDGTTLKGNIWLIGDGDPELDSDDLRSGIRKLQLSGVDRIDGNVFVDGSKFGPDTVTASWLQDDLQYGWAAPASALCLDGGSVQFTVTPRAGTHADVSVDPPGERVVASVETVAEDADNTLTIDRLGDGSGYAVSGDIPYGAPQEYWRAVPHPTQASALSFLALLRHSGIAVAGSAGVGAAPPSRTLLWQHRSRSLDLIIQRMFLLSDNHYAEQLLREIGWKSSGVGTLRNSLQAERSVMEATQIPTAGVRLADGSGLSSHNLVTAAALVAALRFLIEQPMPQPPFTLLPRAGIEGTVSVRNLSAQALGRVFAKDGYIDGASSIAGYVITAHHGPVVFAFIVNDWNYGLDAVWSAEDQMLDAIAAM